MKAKIYFCLSVLIIFILSFSFEFVIEQKMYRSFHDFLDTTLRIRVPETCKNDISDYENKMMTNYLILFLKNGVICNNELKRGEKGMNITIELINEQSTLYNLNISVSEAKDIVRITVGNMDNKYYTRCLIKNDDFFNFLSVYKKLCLR